MFYYISWGRQSYQVWEGVAADFCPICRRASSVYVKQIRVQNHVYHIGIGKGDLVGRLCQCTHCQSSWSLQPNTLSTSIRTNEPISIETLVAETYPNFLYVNAERLRLEAMIAADPFQLSQKDRLQLIADPFFVLENDVTKEGNGSFGKNFLSTLGCLAAIGFTLASLIAFCVSGVWWGLCWLVVTVGLTWGTFKAMETETRRFMRKRIYPRLASCLAPLKPSPEELQAVLSQLTSTSKCASQTRAEDFLPMLEEARRAREYEPQAVGAR